MAWRPHDGVGSKVGTLAVVGLDCVGNPSSLGGMTMAVKLHRCSSLWAKTHWHPCWRVQTALDDAGVDYEIVEEPWPGGRGNTEARTGQKKYPWFEFEDGSIYREESKEMAATIAAGKLFDKQGTQQTAT